MWLAMRCFLIHSDDEACSLSARAVLAAPAGPSTAPTSLFTCQHCIESPRAQVWDRAVAAGCEPDSRMCTTLLEVCTRKGDTARALAMYDRMRDAPAGSRLAPSVHAFTSAMRAAADGGAWEKALDIWNDMLAAGCQPTGIDGVPSVWAPTADTWHFVRASTAPQILTYLLVAGPESLP